MPSLMLLFFDNNFLRFTKKIRVFFSRPRFFDHTLKKNNIRQFFFNIKQLDLSQYDLVISDFEPISAWAAKNQKVPSLAIGHQYAFLYNTPKQGSNIFNDALMKYFAPCNDCFLCLLCFT